MSTIQFGMYTPFYPMDLIVRVAKATGKYDYDSIWAGEHLAAFPTLHAYDAWSELAYFATINKKLRLGIGVGDPHRRHPAVMAQTITTLDILSNGRIIAGFGPGEAMNLDPYGIDWSHPVGKLREYILVMKRLWEGKPVDFQGKYFKINGGCLVPEPVQKPSPPIWVGANSPGALKVTGEVGDGWLPLAESPEGYKKNLTAIRKHAKRAGRSEDEILPALFLYTAVAEEHETARRMAEPVTKLALVFFSHKLRQLGYNYSFGNLEIKHVTVTPENIQDTAKASESIPSEVVAKVCAFGTPDECISRIEEFTKAGARHIVLVPLVPPDACEQNVHLFGKRVIPYFKKKR
jgi:alkanesulfonate monooxygenase SsuD/methylene tetrahydromethanopterin reductase-like flavin-dependent oxidoreductase (luciferase family)